MLEHWIQPLEAPSFQDDFQSGDRLGVHLSKLPRETPEAPRRSIGLIGVDSRWAKYVRRHLYRFGHRMPDILIHDIGNLRRSDPEFVTGALIEMLSAGICPVLIGGHLALVKSFKQSFTYHKELFTPAVIHETIPELFAQSDGKTNVIGVQQHVLPRHIPEKVNTLHLSHAIAEMQYADVLIRESNCTIFDLSAMAFHDVPAQRSVSVSGFDTAAACTIMRSAGLHGETRAMMISGHDPMSLQLDQSANVAAQMIWYFMEAYNQCIIESPAASAHCTGYTVHVDTYDLDLKFYKSERTSRWWVGFPAGTGDNIYPCTYHDYVDAVQGEMSERLLICATASLESLQQSL